MNRKKAQKGLSLSTFLVVITAAILVSAGGIFYVVVKNKQVQTQREIAKVERQIEEHEVAITSYSADIEEHLGVFRLRKQLESEKSSLVAIPPGFVEICQRDEQAQSKTATVASRE